MPENIWLQSGMADTQNHHHENQDLRTYCCNSGSDNFQSWKRSYTKDQQRIQDHISRKPDEVCEKGSEGISLSSRKTGQCQIQIRKKDQSAGDQRVGFGCDISFCVCKIKKSQ